MRSDALQSSLPRRVVSLDMCLKKRVRKSHPSTKPRRTSRLRPQKRYIMVVRCENDITGLDLMDTIGTRLASTLLMLADRALPAILYPEKLWPSTFHHRKQPPGAVFRIPTSLLQKSLTACRGNHLRRDPGHHRRALPVPFRGHGVLRDRQPCRRPPCGPCSWA